MFCGCNYSEEFSMAKSSNNMTATVITVIVALLAACAVFFLIWTAGNQNQQEQQIQQEYVPTEEVANEGHLRGAQAFRYKRHKL